MSSFLCRSNKPLLSIKCNAGPLLSLSVIIFKNTVVQDFRYIVSSAPFLIGNLSGFQTDLTTAGDTSYGSVQKQLSASLLLQGQPCMSASVLLHSTAWKQCFCVEVVQLVNTARLQLVPWRTMELSLLRTLRNKILENNRDITAYKTTDLGQLQANWLMALG